MFGRCHQRPRPMCGIKPAIMPMMPVAPVAPCLPRPIIPMGGACEILKNPHPKVVVEPAIVAAPNVFHHHQFVEHIQPVVTQDIHHYHSHHEYVVKEQKKADEVLNHVHGLCPPAVTTPAMPCPQAVACTPCGR